MDVLAYLVPIRCYGGAQPGDNVPWLASQGAHGLDRGFADPGDRAPPARVHAGQHVRHRVVEDDRHAVGDHHGQHHAGVSGHERVRARNRIVLGQCPPPPVAGRDDLDIRTVGLDTEDEVAGIGVQGSRGAAPVLQYIAGLVPYVQAEVERRVRPGRDPAMPCRHNHVDVERAKGRPSEAAQVPPPAKRRRGRRRCRHQLSLPGTVSTPHPRRKVTRHDPGYKFAYSTFAASTRSAGLRVRRSVCMTSVDRSPSTPSEMVPVLVTPNEMLTVLCESSHGSLPVAALAIVSLMVAMASTRTLSIGSPRTPRRFGCGGGTKGISIVWVSCFVNLPAAPNLVPMNGTRMETSLPPDFVASTPRVICTEATRRSWVLDRRDTPLPVTASFTIQISVSTGMPS